MKRLNKETVSRQRYRQPTKPLLIIDSASGFRFNPGAMSVLKLTPGDRVEIVLPDDNPQTICVAISKKGFKLFTHKTTNSLMFRSRQVADIIRNHLETKQLNIRFKIKPEQETVEGVLCWALSPDNLSL